MDKISPAILIIIVILAVIIFLSALLHFLVRFILKRSIFSSVSHSSRFIESSSGTHPPLQRQLQQLFRLQDSGLDQALIDSLPVFYYKDIMGLKEPFDCAVCLCEFSEDDKLRLLPICSHAFHITCIDTWLLSNSTCPLCRGTILSSGLHFENTLFNFSNHRELQSNISCDEQCASNQEDRVKDALSVRLGSFKILNGGGESGEIYQEESGRHKNLDARRCYSMGSHQYVVGDLELQVAMSNVNGNCALNGDRKISGRIENESFSVSKVWKWSKKGKFPISTDTNNGVST